VVAASTVAAALLKRTDLGLDAAGVLQPWGMTNVGRAVVRVCEQPALRAMWFVYPALVVAMYYVTWVTAWVALGHRPRYMLDDPKYIHWAVDVPSALAALLTYSAPNVLLAAVTFLAVARWGREGSGGQRLRGWLGDLAQLALCWIAALVVLRVDPGGVFAWWLD